MPGRRRGASEGFGFSVPGSDPLRNAPRRCGGGGGGASAAAGPRRLRGLTLASPAPAVLQPQ